jgi:hypothetical protein
MFPISEVDLSFLEISDYWSREIQPPASRWELLDLLIRAWWGGELFGDAPPRLEFLKKMFAKRSDKNELSGIVFTLGEEVGEPTVEWLPDGSADVDICPRVPVPSENTEVWDDASCAPAFQSLNSREVSCVEHYPDWRVAFDWFNLSRDEFMKWLTTRGYSLPTFWSGNQAGGAAVGAMTGAAKGRKGPEPGIVRRYDAADRALFPELEQTMREQKLTRTAAALHLAETTNELLVGSSRHPFVDAARVLIKNGHDPHAVLLMKHAGSDIVALKAPLAKAAKLSVEEGPNGPRFVPFRTGPKRRVAAPPIAPSITGTPKIRLPVRLLHSKMRMRSDQMAEGAPLPAQARQPGLSIAIAEWLRRLASDHDGAALIVAKTVGCYRHSVPAEPPWPAALSTTGRAP